MTLILALGHALEGDNAVGLAVLAELEKAALPTEVTLADASDPGLETAFLLRDDPQVIIIDTAEMGLPPGSWRHYSPEALPPAELAHGSLHYTTIIEALALAAALGRMPEDITIYGVQPESTEMGTDLSPLVRMAVPALAWAIWQQVTAERAISVRVQG